MNGNFLQVEQRLAAITSSLNRPRSDEGSDVQSSQRSTTPVYQSYDQGSSTPSLSPRSASPDAQPLLDTLPDGDSQPLETRVRALFPDFSTFSESLSRPVEPTPTRSGPSRSKQRRERRKRLRASRLPLLIENDEPLPVRPEPEVKNELGIISMRRKDFKPITQEDVKFLIGNIEKHGTVIDISHCVSIYKNTLRIFCDSKVKLQNIWKSTKHFPDLPDHPGFSYALPGIRFSDLIRIECRLPDLYWSYDYRSSTATLVTQFLAGCPGFDKSQVKFVRMMKLKQHLSNNDPHRHLTPRNKCVVLILDVSQDLFDYIRSRAYMTKLNRKWRVKWRRSKVEARFRNKVYKKVENFQDYLVRKRFVTLQARKTVSYCFDFRCQASPDVR